ncbi:hypothetical protein Dimus_018991 [Dionaea muscipula]
MMENDDEWGHKEEHCKGRPPDKFEWSPKGVQPTASGTVESGKDRQLVGEAQLGVTNASSNVGKDQGEVDHWVAVKGKSCSRRDRVDAPGVAPKVTLLGSWFQSLGEIESSSEIIAIVNEQLRGILNPYLSAGAEIGRVLVDYFGQLLGSSAVEREHINIGFAAARPVLSAEHKKLLVTDFSVQDVRNALIGINVDKVPEVDGYSSFFFIKA